MKLCKVYKKTIFLLILFQICFNFCWNALLFDSNNYQDLNKNKLNLKYAPENSQSIDDYLDELVKNEGENKLENFFLEKTTSINLNILENAYESRFSNGNATNNSTNKNNTGKPKKPFFKYKKNKTSAEPDQGTFRSADGKWNVVALIKATDLMLEAFININPRLKIKNGKLWLAKILLKQFEECDNNSDSKLDLKEFKGCIDKQKYFGVLSDVPKKNAARVFTRVLKLQNIYGVSSIDEAANGAKNSSDSTGARGQNNTKSNSKSQNATANKNNTKEGKENKNTNYLELIFNILNDSKNKYFSIHEYIKLRFLMLVYRKCNAGSFFLSKSDFECIANEFNPEGYTKSANTLSRIYNQIQSFTRFESLNDLDSINALSALQSIDLFGKINKRHVDPTVSKAAFLDALGANELPQRFNAKNIENIFSQLSHENGKPADKIDLHTFVFVDRFLRIFHDNSQKFKLLNINENYVDINGFLNCFRSYLYPAKYVRLFMVHLKQYDVKNITKYEVNKELNFIPLNLKENVEADKLILLQKNQISFEAEESKNKENNRSMKTTLRNKYSISNGNLSNNKIKNLINFNFKEKAESETENTFSSFQSTTTTTTTTRRIIKRSSSSSSDSSSGSSSTSNKKIINKKIINNSNSAGSAGISRNKQKAETSGLFFNEKIDILLPKDYNIYLENFFDILYRKINDRDLVGFDDFLYLMQFMYLYPKTELKFNLFTEKAKLHDFFSLYSDFPLISPRFYSRYVNFRKMKENTVLDFYMAFLFFSYEELVSKVKSTKGETVNKLSKPEIRRLLERVHILNVPDFLFKKCYTNNENRVSKMEGQFDVNCMFNNCIEYVGQNINNDLLSYYLKYNVITAE